MKKVQCSACGQIGGASFRYCQGTQANGPLSMCPRGEHIHIHCHDCGYIGIQDCRDAKDAKPWPREWTKPRDWRSKKTLCAVDKTTGRTL